MAQYCGAWLIGMEFKFGNEVEAFCKEDNSWHLAWIEYARSDSNCVTYRVRYSEDDFADLPATSIRASEENSQLSHSLEALIAKWFSEMMNPRDVLWKLMHDNIRFRYAPGLRGTEKEILQCVRERLEQLGMSSTAKLDFHMSRWFAGSGDNSNVVVVTGPGDLLADVRRLVEGSSEPVIMDSPATVETTGQTDERAEAFLRR